MHYFPPALYVGVVFACPDVQTFLASGNVGKGDGSRWGFEPRSHTNPREWFPKKTSMEALHLKKLFWLNSFVLIMVKHEPSYVGLMLHNNEMGIEELVQLHP
jgi:hypothetical protein